MVGGFECTHCIFTMNIKNIHTLLNYTHWAMTRYQIKHCKYVVFLKVSRMMLLVCSLSFVTV